MTSWEDVKRLQADFQKIQLSSTTQKLSERNCIEIVTWLLNKKHLDLIFTSDGKEYLTSSQLVTEIRNELYANGGRVNFVELSKSIGVDLTHINTHINEVLNGQTFAVVGQLIDSTYLEKIASEINEKLAQQGQINVSDLTIHYDLPSDFMQTNVIDKYLGRLIFGEQDRNDSKVYFTEAFVAKSKAKIKGALAALTLPCPVSLILSKINMNDKLFFSLFDQVNTYGSLTGRSQGATYVPNVYSRSQSEWFTNFYKQNGYIEYSTLNKLGVHDHKTYLKRHFTSEDIVFLHSYIISKSSLDRVEAEIDESIASKSFVDLQHSLPSVSNEEDIEMVLERVLDPKRKRQVILFDNVVVSKSFIDSLKDMCQEVVKNNAKSFVTSGKYQKYQTAMTVSSNKSAKRVDDDENGKVDKREERRKKAAGGKSGGGTQGRETKTKSTKKLYKVSRTENLSDDEEEKVESKSVVEVVSVKDINSVIGDKLEEEGLDEILEKILNNLLTPLNEIALEEASKLYSSMVSDQSANRRSIHNDIQTRINSLLIDIRLFEKGIKCFPADTQVNFYKYLLKSLGGDTLNLLINYVASEEKSNISVNDTLTNDQKLKIISGFSNEYKNSLQTLLKSLSGQNLEAFLSSVEETMATCSMIIKKVDKKKDKARVIAHKEELLNQLDKCDDSALVLHLACLIIFMGAMRCMLHASGRHVALLLTILKTHITEDQYTTLSSYYDLVAIMLNNSSDTEILDKLKEKIPIIKSIAMEYSKENADKS